MKTVIKKSAIKKPLSSAKKTDDLFYVYMIESENGSLYTGYTVDIKARWKKHCEGKGARFTRAFRPLRLAACWEITGTKGEAMRIEAFIKTLQKKEKLFLTENPRALKRYFIDKKRIDLYAVPCKVYKIKKM